MAEKNVGSKIPKIIFSKLIGEIWTESTPQVIKNGLVKAGIFPFNKDVVPKEAFDPTALKRWENQHYHIW
jgi:hypothetical protein